MIAIPNLLLQSCDNLFLAYNFRSYNNFAVTYFFLLLFVGLQDDSSNYLLHISNPMPLNAVRWNPGNQDEVPADSFFHALRHFSIFIPSVPIQATQILMMVAKHH